jgi:Splicing factor 1 helix-hairpin domain
MLKTILIEHQIWSPSEPEPHHVTAPNAAPCGSGSATVVIRHVSSKLIRLPDSMVVTYADHCCGSGSRIDLYPGSATLLLTARLLSPRLPSPEPIYSSDGKWLNMQEYRKRKQVEEERHEAVQRMLLNNPDHKPPTDSM